MSVPVDPKGSQAVMMEQHAWVVDALVAVADRAHRVDAERDRLRDLLSRGVELASFPSDQHAAWLREARSVLSGGVVTGHPPSELPIPEEAIRVAAKAIECGDHPLDVVRQILDAMGATVERGNRPEMSMSSAGGVVESRAKGTSGSHERIVTAWRSRV